MIPKSNLKKICLVFSNLYAKIEPKGLKKRDTFLHKCVLDSYLHLSSVWEAPFCQKCQNRCTLLIVYETLYSTVDERDRRRWVRGGLPFG